MNDSFNRVLSLVRCVEGSLKVVSSDIYSGSLLALVLSTLASDELRTLLEIIKTPRNYKDTHRNKPENCFFGAARYQGCLVNSGVVIDMPVPIRA
jgi:hypothetical protein